MDKIICKILIGFIIIFFFFPSFQLSGQYQVGIVAGFSNNDLSAGRYTEYELFSYTPGFSFGIHANKLLYKHLKIETELSFSQRSIEELNKSNEYNYYVTGKKLKQYSITLPLYLSVRFDHLHVLAGMYYDYILSSTIPAPFDNHLLQSVTFDKKYDIGYQFGGYYQLHQFNIGVRFFRGLVKQDSIETANKPIREIELYTIKNLQFFIRYNL